MYTFNYFFFLYNIDFRIKVIKFSNSINNKLEFIDNASSIFEEYIIPFDTGSFRSINLYNLMNSFGIPGDETFEKLFIIELKESE